MQYNTNTFDGHYGGRVKHEKCIGCDARPLSNPLNDSKNTASQLSTLGDQEPKKGPLTKFGIAHDNISPSHIPCTLASCARVSSRRKDILSTNTSFYSSQALIFFDPPLPAYQDLNQLQQRIPSKTLFELAHHWHRPERRSFGKQETRCLECIVG